MANFETSLTKGRDGWVARTYVPIANRPGYFLQVRTSKTRGGVHTSAGTELHEGSSVTTRIFRDFRATVVAEPCRCTEKSVRDQHARALEQVPALLEKEAAWEAEQVQMEAA